MSQSDSRPEEEDWRDFEVQEPAVEVREGMLFRDNRGGTGFVLKIDKIEKGFVHYTSTDRSGEIVKKDYVGINHFKSDWLQDLELMSD